MKIVNIPGVFWAILIVTLVPALVPVLEQVFPAATYAWSAVLVVVLIAVAKTVEITYRKQIDKAITPKPAAMAAPGGAPDGDDYTYETPQPAKPRPVLTWLVG